MYPEVDEMHTEKDQGVMALIGTPGLTSLFALPTSPVRALYLSTTGVLYCVAGNTLYTLTLTNGIWSHTSIGTLTTISGQVSMVDNGVQLFLVDGLVAYFVTLGTSTLSAVSNPGWTNPVQVVLLDGFFTVSQQNSFKFFVSDELAVTFPLGVSFGSKESPDYLISMIVDHRNLWLFGASTSEVWYDAGAAPPSIPFQVIQGAYMEKGSVAPFSAQQVDNTIVWLGQDQNGTGVVYMTNGYQPQRISTHAIEFAIQQYGDLSTSYAWTYEENGHQFYVLNFPLGETTWVYDMTTSLWHERCFNNQGILERHRASCHAYAYNMHIVGDYQTGDVYQMSSEIYTDNGTALIKKRTAPHLSSDMDRVFHSEFQLDFEPGVGIDGSGQGVIPQAVLRFSNDGGYTWSNESWSSMGPIGAKKHRAIWRRLGVSRDRVYEITVSDPVKTIMIGAEILAELGQS